MNTQFVNIRAPHALLIGIILSSNISTEAQVSEEPPLQLETLVITASRHETLLMESPVAISSIPRNQIERRPIASIAELVRDLPGVMVADNTIPGMQRLRIRGEEARRSLVLIDGQEVSDHSTFGPPLLVSPSMIERIEVVRGPHSTLYGSRAAGGVINIITRDLDNDAFRGSIGTAYSGATDGHRIDASAAGGSGPWTYQFAINASRDDDRKIPSGTLDKTSHESDGYMGRIGWRSDNHELGLTFDRFDMSSEASVPDSLVDGFIFSKFELDLPARNRKKAGLSYDGWQLMPRLDRLHFDVYGQTVDRNITQEIAGVVLPPTRPPKFYDYFNDDRDTIDSLGANLQTDWRPAEKHRLIVGANYLKDDMDKVIDRTGSIIFGSLVTPSNLRSSTQSSIETQAIFANDTWNATDQIQLTAGVRQYFVTSKLIDSNDPALLPKSSSDSKAIASLAASYRLSPNLVARAQWGQGYVYPTLLHLHTGSLFGQGTITRPNRNLKPESSENFELGLRYQSEIYTLDTSVFSNTASDYIAKVSASNFPELGWGAHEDTYANLESARTKGIEMLFAARLPKTDFELYAQGTFLSRELEYANYTTDEYGQPKFTGRTGFRFDKKLYERTTWYLDSYANYGSQSRERTSRSTRFADSWTTVNLSLGINIKAERDWWIGIEALNLTDEEYRPSTDELVQPGRHLTIGSRVGF